MFKLTHLYWKLPKKTRKRIMKIYTFLRLRIIIPRYYKLCQKRRTINPKKVVFIEVRLPEISNNFKLLYQKLKDDYDMEIHTCLLRNTFVNQEQYLKNCLKMVKEVADAKYVFINEGSNIFSAIPLRDETVVVQTWHGCGAFKKFGFSTAEKKFGASRKQGLKYPFYKNYTYVTVSSPEVIWAYAEAMGMDEEERKKIKPIGISRTDVFYDESFRNSSFYHLYELFPEAKGKKVLLYAPTFRGKTATATTPDIIDIPLMKDSFGEEYVMIFKHHPIVKKRPVIEESCKDFARDFTFDMAIEELICVSDVCIADYSSLVFEYSLTNRPMIFLAHDIEEYDDWRGFYYPFSEFAPGPVVKTNEQLIEAIKNINYTDASRITEFRNKFMSSCDGHATERILNLIMEEKENYV